MTLSVPARVQGQDADGPFEEMTATEDASFGGASFIIKRTVVFGQVLRVDLPLPKTFRNYSLSDPSYTTYALVRSVNPVLRGFRVGVMFLGKTPPKGFEQNPTGRYLLPTDPKPAPKERRQFRRLDIHLNLRLKRTELSTQGPSEELTIAENIGRCGARVLTSLLVSKGEVVLIEELDGPFRTRAEIRNVYIGKDNVPRLNLHFLDAEAPDRLVATG